MAFFDIISTLVRGNIMLNTKGRVVCTLALLAMLPPKVMAGSIDVKIIDAIHLMACKLTFVGNGCSDYGVISPVSLKQDTVTIWDAKQLCFTITKDVPTWRMVNATETNALSGQAGRYGVFKGEPLHPKSINVTDTGLLDVDKKTERYGIWAVRDAYIVDGNTSLLLHHNMSGVWKRQIINNDTMCNTPGKHQQYPWGKISRKLRFFAKWLLAR
ncbi:hypothetical protein BV925_20240 [Pectobacterium odoriferum]|nr:hypothetical protein BV925_20240 [Pectobacterium odoriferum]